MRQRFPTSGAPTVVKKTTAQFKQQIKRLSETEVEQKTFVSSHYYVAIFVNICVCHGKDIMKNKQISNRCTKPMAGKASVLSSASPFVRWTGYLLSQAMTRMWKLLHLYGMISGSAFMNLIYTQPLSEDPQQQCVFLL